MKDLSKDAVNWLAIEEDFAGQRVDNFLLRVLKGVPKSHVYRIVRSGEVRVNSRRVGPDTKLASGDRVRVPPIRMGKPAASPSARATRVRRVAFSILYEDESLIAIDKPAGLAVHGGSGVALGLIEELRLARPDARFLELVHRLDRATSGVLLVAKKRSALTALHALWRDGNIDKRYLVLVKGLWDQPRKAVRLALARYVTAEGERRVRVDLHGQAAETVFRRRQQWPHALPQLSLLEAELKTGRTHQIRVHLTQLGFPLAGDDKYGDFAWNRELAKEGLKRMFLHAATLALSHPVSRAPLVLRSPLPPDLAHFLARLEAPGIDAARA